MDANSSTTTTLSPSTRWTSSPAWSWRCVVTSWGEAFQHQTTSIQVLGSRPSIQGPTARIDGIKEIWRDMLDLTGQAAVAAVRARSPLLGVEGLVKERRLGLSPNGLPQMLKLIRIVILHVTQFNQLLALVPPLLFRAQTVLPLREHDDRYATCGLRAPVLDRINPLVVAPHAVAHTPCGAPTPR